MYYMPTMPESEKTITDMVDIVLESWKVPQYIETEDGHTKLERIIDERRAWWQTHHIGTNSLGRLALYRELLGNLFRNATDHMTAHRAISFQRQGNDFCKAIDYSIDAKSSECLRDNNNAQLTLLAMLAKAKSERQFTVKGEVGKSVLDGILGRQADKQANG